MTTMQSIWQDWFEAALKNKEANNIYYYQHINYDHAHAPIFINATSDKHCNTVLLEYMEQTEDLEWIDSVLFGYFADEGVSTLMQENGFDVESPDWDHEGYIELLRSQGPTYLFDVISQWSDSDVEGAYTVLYPLESHNIIGLKEILPDDLTNASAKTQAQWLVNGIMTQTLTCNFLYDSDLTLFLRPKTTSLFERLRSPELWSKVIDILSDTHQNIFNTSARISNEFQTFFEASTRTLIELTSGTQHGTAMRNIIGTTFPTDLNYEQEDQWTDIFYELEEHDFNKAYKSHIQQLQEAINTGYIYFKGDNINPIELNDACSLELIGALPVEDNPGEDAR